MSLNLLKILNKVDIENPKKIILTWEELSWLIDQTDIIQKDYFVWREYQDISKHIENTS